VSKSHHQFLLLVCWEQQQPAEWVRGVFFFPRFYSFVFLDFRLLRKNFFLSFPFLSSRLGRSSQNFADVWIVVSFDCAIEDYGAALLLSFRGFVVLGFRLWNGVVLVKELISSRLGRGYRIFEL
jgi:hypothetical protein